MSTIDCKNIHGFNEIVDEVGVYHQHNVNKFTKHLAHKFMSYMYDKDYIINYISDGVKCIFGVTPDNIIGSSFFEEVSWSQHELQRIRMVEKKLLDNPNQSEQIDTSFINRHGITKHIRMTQYAISNDSKFLGYEGIIEDITKEKEHELEEKRLIKELSSLNELSHNINTFHNIDDLLKNSTSTISNGCCIPRDTSTTITFDDKSYTDVIIENASCINSCDILIDGKKRGTMSTTIKCTSALCSKKTYTNQVKFLEIAGEQLAAALDNLIMKKNLEEMAKHDSLTNLYNRNVLNKEIHNELEKAKRYSRDLSIVLIDIDYFKTINDTFGHQAGDHVLVKLSELFLQEIRSSDYAIRYGGEEFALVLPEASIDKALEISLRLLTKVQQTKFNIDGAQINITISIGISSFPNHSDDLDQLLNMADEALYEAKNSGRDTVYIYT